MIREILFIVNHNEVNNAITFNSIDFIRKTILDRGTVFVKNIFEFNFS